MNLPRYELVGGPLKQKTKSGYSRKWYQPYRLEGAPARATKRAPCCKDKGESRRLANKFVEAHIAKRFGGQGVDHASVPLSKHLEAYIDWREAKHLDPDFNRITKRRMERLLTECKFRFHRDINPETLLKWLVKQQGPGRYQHTQQTTHQWMACMKAFTKWLSRPPRKLADPLADVSTKHGSSRDFTPTFQRRALTEEEFGRLIQKARESEKTIYLLGGEDRAALYMLAAQTGFRCQELASLTPRSFSLDADPPTVMVDCTISKRRKHDVQELQPEIAQELARYLEGRDPDQPVWSSCWFKLAARMLRRDLAAASIEPETDAGRVDFHALRASFVTWLGESGAPVALIQRIARLSTPMLLNNYFRPNDAARTAAISKLPKLAPASPGS